MKHMGIETEKYVLALNVTLSNQQMNELHASSSGLGLALGSRNENYMMINHVPFLLDRKRLIFAQLM